MLIIRPNTTYRSSTIRFLIHYKVVRLCRSAISSQDVWICVNMRTALNTVLANVNCEKSSVNNIFIFYPFIIFYLDFYPIYFKVPYLIHTEFCNMICISFNLIIPFFFWNNIVIIHKNLIRGSCYLIFLFVCPTST